MEGHRQLYPSHDEDEARNVEGDTAPLIANAHTLKQKFENVPILWYLLVCVTLLGLEEFIQKAPTVRLIESAICRQHYSSVDHQGPIDEPMCKLDAIQQRLAFIQGRQGLFDALAGMLVMIPCSYLADKYGRRIVFLLAELGLSMAMGWMLLICYSWETIPIQLVWVSAAFRLVGGGPSGAHAMLLTMAADTSSDITRSRNFYKIFTAMLVAELLGPPISYGIMERSLWLPYLVCIISLSLSFPILLVMPETLTLKLDDGFDVDVEPPLIYKLIATDRRLILALVAVFSVQFRDQTIDVLLPYTSKRFGWPLSQTNSLVSVVAGVNIVLFLVVLPLTTKVLQRKTEMRTTHTELLVTRVSFSLLTTGTVAMAIAWTPTLLFIALIVFAAGFGARISLMSVITAVVIPSYVARVYAVGATIEKISQIFSSPTVRSAWSQGIAWGGQWMGFPFIVIALFFGCGAVCTLLFRSKDLCRVEQGSEQEVIQPIEE